MEAYPVYKRINAEAEIFGFPFMVFFGLAFFLLVSLLILYIAPLGLKLVWLPVFTIVTVLSFYTFIKFGIKETRKKSELFFRNPKSVKYNQQMVIQKMNFQIHKH